MTSSTEPGSTSRSIDEPIKLLMAGMLRNASDDIDKFIANSDRDYFANTNLSNKHVREYLIPVVCVIEWLASADDASATLITFNNACEMLGLCPEATQELFLKKIRGISNAGRSAIRRYVSGILSDDKQFRQYRLFSRGPGKNPYRRHCGKPK